MLAMLHRPPPLSPADLLERRGDVILAEALRWVDTDEATAYALACEARRAYDEAAALRA